MSPHALLEPALLHLVRVAQERILPRFRALHEDQIHTKSSAHDLVTIADQEAEADLATLLPALLPGSVVLGEEAASQAPDPAALARSLLLGPRPAWIVDPVDGTWNFARGDERFCVMVALSLHDQVQAAWILEPRRRRAFVAARGHGTWRHDLSADGAPPVRVTVPAPPADLSDWRGSIYHRSLPPEQWPRRPRVERQGSAGIEYVRILTGEAEFCMYDRTMPWDHAPGHLLIEEAGGRHAFLDGADYQPSGGPLRAVMAAARPADWPALRERLLPRAG